MKIEFNGRVYRAAKSFLGCPKCSLADDKCLLNRKRCFLLLDEIFVYGSYSQLFEL